MKESQNKNNEKEEAGPAREYINEGLASRLPQGTPTQT